MLKTAVITGASSGVGRATAIALSPECNLILTGRRLAQLEETAKACTGPTLVIPGDITDEEFVKTLFGKAIEKFGRLDLLFNNAGVSMQAVSITLTSLQSFNDVLQTNLIAPFLCSRAAFGIFQSQSPPGGRIINNGSISAQVPRPMSYAYSASKSALWAFTKTLALEGRQYDISVTQIDEGNTSTDMGSAAGRGEGALQPNGEWIQEKVMDVNHVAETVKYVVGLPNEVEVLHLTIMATGTPFIGRG